MGDVGEPGMDWRWMPSPLSRPVHTVCAIRHSTGAKNTAGTGTLIAPRIVVTAAHVVDVGQPRVRNGRFWVAPGAGLHAVQGLNRSKFISTRWIEKSFLLAASVQAGDPDDFAFCVLNRPVAEDSYVRPTVVQDSSPRNARVPGYPVHDEVQGATGMNLLEGAGLGYIDAAQPHRILYHLDTEGGHSGAPVFFDAGNRKYGIFAGIHVADQYMAQTDANMGLRFLSQHLAMIDEIVNMVES